VRDGTLSLTGTFTNYNAATQTLSGGQYRVTGGVGNLGTTRLRWTNANVSVNDAAVVLDGPNAQLADLSNNNALINLTRNTAAGSLTVSHGADLAVNGV